MKLVLQAYDRLTDRDYVASTWLRQLVPAALDWPEFKTRTRDYCYRSLNERINATLDRGRTLLATDADHPTVCLGWACVSRHTLRAVYVRRLCRRQGVATALLAALGPLTAYEAP